MEPHDASMSMEEGVEVYKGKVLGIEEKHTWRKEGQYKSESSMDTDTYTLVMRRT
jgi:hypothetical protein